MKKVILSKEWEKDAPSRQKAVAKMKEHPLTLDELIEQQKCNERIRQENILRSKF